MPQTPKAHQHTGQYPSPLHHTPGRHLTTRGHPHSLEPPKLRKLSNPRTAQNCLCPPFLPTETKRRWWACTPGASHLPWPWCCRTWLRVESSSLFTPYCTQPILGVLTVTMWRMVSRLETRSHLSSQQVQKTHLTKYNTSHDRQQIRTRMKQSDKGHL